MILSAQTKKKKKPKPSGLTALHVAAALHPESVPLLIAAGARLRRSTFGETPLHRALVAGNDQSALQVMQALMAGRHALKHLNAPANRNGEPVLFGVARLGHLETCKFLVHSKANVNRPLLPCLGLCPLHEAVMSNHLSVAQFLVSAGACTHPVMGASLGLSSLSQLAKTPAMRDWCRSVETPFVVQCEQCQFQCSQTRENTDRLLEAHAKLRQDQRLVSLTQKHCSNPHCTAVMDARWPPLLKKMRALSTSGLLQVYVCFVPPTCRWPMFCAANRARLSTGVNTKASASVSSANTNHETRTFKLELALPGRSRNQSESHTNGKAFCFHWATLFRQAKMLHLGLNWRI